MKKKGLIFGVILIIVIVIGVICYVALRKENTNIESEYEQSKSVNEENSTENLVDNTKESETVTVDSFNSQFNTYYGKGVTYSELNSMIDKLIENVEKYNGKSEYLPTVKLINRDGGTTTVQGEDGAEHNSEEYIENLTKLKDEISDSTTYTCEMIYDDSGLIDEIWVYYE